MADIQRLPRPTVSSWDWQLQAACRGMDSELFFRPDQERGVERAAREARAKRVCRSCPVLEQCRQHALSTQEPFGVWGGLSETERATLLRSYRSAALSG